MFGSGQGCFVLTKRFQVRLLLLSFDFPSGELFHDIYCIRGYMQYLNEVALDFRRRRLHLHVYSIISINCVSLVICIYSLLVVFNFNPFLLHVHAYSISTLFNYYI